MDGAVERMEQVHLSTEEEEDEIVISEEIGGKSGVVMPV